MNPIRSRKFLLLGAHGLLGSSLLRALEKSGARVECLEWLSLAELTPEQRAAEVLRVIDTVGKDSELDVLFAGGLTYPQIDPAELLDSNFEFPKSVIIPGLERPQTRYLTIGTAFEEMPDAENGNAYLQSKWKLSQWVQSLNSDRVIHLRVHTLYGEIPKPHMFLGQIVECLRENKVFKMSTGEQLREYHHVDDVADSIVQLLDKKWTMGPVVSLNSGRPLKLAHLAQQIFGFFKKKQLLETGVLPHESVENWEQSFKPSPDWLLGNSREPFSGVIRSVRKMLE